MALAAGSRAAGGAARDGVRAGAGAAWRSPCRRLVRSSSTLLQADRPPHRRAVARPNIGGPLALAGAIALGAGIGRSRGVGLDGEAVTTLSIGVVLMASLLPMLGAASTLAPAAAVGSGSPRWLRGAGGAGRRRGLVRQRRRPRQAGLRSATCR